VIREVSDLESAQRSMFAEEDLPRYDPGADDARARLESTLGKMRTAASWPWKADTVSAYRENLWPSLLGRLPDRDEATRLRAELDAEIARLDAAQ
jgi:hypothetical protein